MRTPRGYVPTEATDQLVGVATRMEVLEIDNRAAGTDASLNAVVRIGTSDALGYGYVPPAAASVRRACAAIRIEVDIASAFSNLSQRENDIVVRTVRPTDSSTIVRRLPGLATALYASAAYLAGPPPQKI